MTAERIDFAGLDDRTRVEAVVWQILRGYTVAVLAPDVAPEETAVRSSVIDPHTSTMSEATAMLMVAFDAALASRIEAVSRALLERTALEPDVAADVMEAVAVTWTEGSAA